MSKIQIEQLAQTERRLLAIIDEMPPSLPYQDRLTLLKSKYELQLHPSGEITVIEKDKL